jgi:tetratricopeptide (TPR) repeat protein
MEARTVAEARNLAEPPFTMGLEMLQQGKLQAAEACFRAALRYCPDFAEAHYELGVALFRQERVEEAAVAYQEALGLRPDFLLARIHLGAARTDLGELLNAVKDFHEALHLEPNSAAAHENLTVTLIQLGRFAEAIVHGEAALRLDPRAATTYFHLGELAAQGHYQFAESQIQHMEDLLHSAELGTEDQSCLHFTRATLLERAGRYEEAFERYRQANDLKRQFFERQHCAYDHEYHRSYLDRLMATCDCAFFERTRTLGLQTARPMFVVGMPRSGTTLVQQILSSHPQISSGGELRDLDHILNRSPVARALGGVYPQSLAALNRESAHALSQLYLQRLDRIDGSALRVIDKMPQNYLHLGAIAVLFPQARIIHCRRDPLDTCLSCYFQNFKWLNYATRLEDLGAHYQEYERLMEHWDAVVPLQVYTIRYEELVTRPEALIREMVAFCGVDWDARCLAFHENPRAVGTASKLQVRQPFYTSSIGRWKRYEKHLGPLQKALADRPTSTQTRIY